jgi:hypothetical protein
MKTKLNCKSLFGHSGQVIAWLIGIFFALSFPVAPRAHAQSGGPGADAGVVTSIDDNRLEIRSGSHTTTYVETEQTQWLNKRGQRIDAGDVVGKMVEVRFRWITGGSEALSVRITSDSSTSTGSSRSAAAEESGARTSRAKSSGSGEIWGFVKSIDDMLLDLRDANGNTQNLRETEETRWLNKRGKRIEAGDTVGKWVEVTFRSTGDGREVLSVQLR